MSIRQNKPVFTPELEWTEAELFSGKYRPVKTWKYILKTLFGRIVPWLKPTEAQAQRVYDDLISYTRSNYVGDMHHAINVINDGWPTVKKLLLNNAGLVSYFNDYGSQSLGFYRFIQLVPRAVALESAFGAGYRNDGIYGTFRGDFPMSCSGVAEPIFVELRWRDYLSQAVIREELALYRSGKKKQKPRIISLGAGLLAEFRRFGFTLEDIRDLDIIVCDMDEGLLSDLDVVFMHDFGVKFSESGIKFCICDVDEMCNNPELLGTADVVLMDGVLSYYPKLRDMQGKVAGAMRLLKQGGKLACDLQVMHLTLIRCVIVFYWISSMIPELSARRALRKMRKICKNLGIEIVRSRVDPRNDKPVGVHFVLQKN